MWTLSEMASSRIAKIIKMEVSQTLFIGYIVIIACVPRHPTGAQIWYFLVSLKILQVLVNQFTQQSHVFGTHLSDFFPEWGALRVGAATCYSYIPWATAATAITYIF